MVGKLRVVDIFCLALLDEEQYFKWLESLCLVCSFHLSVCLHEFNKVI